MRRHTTLKGTLMTLNKPAKIACFVLGSLAASAVLNFAIQKGMEAYYGPEYRDLCKLYREIARGK
nr:MAG TPA: hypothetical protein [Caudoviricetes sp.]